jgi:DNA-binding protein WhiA
MKKNLSFSAEVKKELFICDFKSKSEMLSECYGMLLFASKFNSREIIYKTENSYSAKRFEKLITELFQPIIEKQYDNKKSSQSLYKFSLIVPDECKRIFEAFGHNVKDIKLRINRANLEDESCYPAFLRGVFLSCGSVTDPRKSYHLELSVSYRTLAENVIHLINEIEVFNLKPKLAARKGGYIVYLKGNSDICDFLAYIGAGNSVMNIIETTAYKEMINKINRKQNSELANIRKKADASAKQILAIKKIIKVKGIDYLSDDLKALALLRLDNPDMSLKELGENLNPKISRSGVNHRLEKIFRIADSI